MPLKVIAIAAMDSGRVIGAKGTLPWHVPADMRHFSELTKGHTVLMGRTTYDSLPDKFRPLPQRKNIVITSRPLPKSEVEVWSDPLECISQIRKNSEALPSSLLWIIGGEKIYRATLAYWDEVALTVVPGMHSGDAYFPEFEREFDLLDERDGEGCRFLRYGRRGMS